MSKAKPGKGDEATNQNEAGGASGHDAMLAAQETATVRVRKVRPPDGTHPLIGEVKLGGEYDVSGDVAEAVTASGEFERV
jgi:hypothetical protein